MELNDILEPDCVHVCAQVADKPALLAGLAARAAEVTGLDEAQILGALMQREELGSTGLGNGIAIPHGKISGLDKVLALFAKVDPAIEFDAVDDQPVDLVMMLLAPPGAGADHLKALARVARLLRSDQVAEALRGARTAEDLYRVLMEPLPDSVAA